MINNIKKIKNTKKKKFDHSNNYYYEIDIDNNKKLLFTASELNKAYDRYKKWNKK